MIGIPKLNYIGAAESFDLPKGVFSPYRCASSCYTAYNSALESSTRSAIILLYFNIRYGPRYSFGDNELVPNSLDSFFYLFLRA